MKAMILAAGNATRLRPLTDTKPKALIEIKDIPLLELVILYLKKYGFTELIINLHHFGDQIRKFIEEKNSFGISIQFSDETDELLDTGGGVLNAKWFFKDDKPFLVYNVDILTDLNLNDLLEFHLNTKALVSLAVRDRQTSRKLLLDSDNQLCEWHNLSNGQRKISRTPNGETKLLAYSGIQIINPSIFDFISESGAFSIIDLYLRLANSQKINGFIHNSGHWHDLGKYNEVIEFNKHQNINFLY